MIVSKHLGMKFRTLIWNSTLPWTLVGMFFVYLLLSYTFTALSDCPAEGNYYVASPSGTHVAHHYYYACGGATVGFTQNLDIDGHTVFSTYGGGNDNIEVAWLSEDELQLRYFEEVVHVQIYEPEYDGIKVQYSPRGGDSEETLKQIREAREKVGY